MGRPVSGASFLLPAGSAQEAVGRVRPAILGKDIKMDTKPNADKSESSKNLISFVIARMKEGKDKASITQEVVDQGMDKSEASRLIDAAYRQVVAVVQKELPTTTAIQTGILGGLVAAIAGGIAWGLIAVHSGYELGIAAWGLGFLSGYAVVLFTGGKKGTPLQVVAAVSSVLAILVGKYVMFFHDFTELIAETNAELADSLSAFSLDVIQVFFESLPQLVGGYDILWIILALASAWKIPKGTGIRLPQQYQMPYVSG
jgi:hypothetical protein